jgi:multidrug efflux pump subunit AcrB
MTRLPIRMPFWVCLALVASACSSRSSSSPAPTFVMPKVNVTGVKIKVTASYPGHTAEEVQKLLGAPLNEHLENLEGVDSKTLIALQDSCTVVLIFSHEVDEARALDIVQKALADTSYLPADLPRKPQASPYRHPPGSIFNSTQKTEPAR